MKAESESGESCLCFETLQEHLGEQAELRKGLENTYTKEAMEAEELIGADGCGAKKLTGTQVAATKTKVGKGKTRDLAMLDFSTSTTKDRQGYIRAVGGAPGEFGEIAKDTMVSMPGVRETT